MATEIRSTPVLFGKDAERFIHNMNNPKPVSKERLLEIRESAAKMQNILRKSKI